MLRSPGKINGPIRRLLVANRGEIACRIMKTARRMNIQTTAIYSNVDRNSHHVKLADRAHSLGSRPEPQFSYLDQEKLFDIAKLHQIDAIHPGYGFLSENLEFAQRCQTEQLTFVGPSAESIRQMGLKNESKRIMIEAGVPVVPGYHGLEQTNERLQQEAQAIGYPLMIKPVRGGGGKGMRIVRDETQFIESLESSRRESLKSFNDDTMLLERYIERPRHIEVQVFGDHYKNHVYLFERDCSIQRRHQKIIEEAPAPNLSDDLRAHLGRQAVAAARAVDYLGAGTVEFILDKDTNEFYFMEMNTRLQVEHPITEMVTGVDLVEWQLRVAAGEPLPKQQLELVAPRGHAIEARIYAESPSDNFLPQTGQLQWVVEPNNCSSFVSESEQAREEPKNLIEFYRNKVRLDTGVSSGDFISPYYDPMIAKLIVWDETRAAALQRLQDALSQYTVLGIDTNVGFLGRLLEHRSFQEADLGTDFIDQHHKELFAPRATGILSQLAMGEICAAVHLLTRTNICDSFKSFRMLGFHTPNLEFELTARDETIKVRLETKTNKLQIFAMSSESKEPVARCTFEARQSGDDLVEISLNEGQSVEKFRILSPIIASKSNETSIILQRHRNGQSQIITFRANRPFESSRRADAFANQNPLVACAPMPGIIEKVLVKAGDTVELGQSLVVMSAMKMEYTIKSNAKGQVEEVRKHKGDFVPKNEIIVKLSSGQ